MIEASRLDPMGSVINRADDLRQANPAFRLIVASSWLAPDSCKTQQGQAIREAYASGPDWDRYLLLVKRHRIPALSWAVLKRVEGLGIPEEVAGALRKGNDACRVQALMHLQALAGILKEFNHASIPVMPLKGPLLSLELYGDTGLRQSKDLDIMVASEHIGRGQECLEAMGWRRGAGYASLSCRQAEFNRRYEHHLGYIHPQRTCELELHWRADWDTPAFAADRLARSTPATWQGCSYLEMDPVDLALYLCNHGSGHAWFRAKWLGDLARLFMVKPMDWRFLLDKARATGQERPMLIGLRLLKDLYGLPIDQSVEVRWRSLPQSLIDKGVRELTSVEEPETRTVPARLVEEIRSYGYKRRLWPHRSRWETFVAVAFCRVDFKTLRLPDVLFWFYIPLRPFLWAKRHFWDSIRARRNARSEAS